jgi:DNA-binding CsgD family transcriptional regulator
VLTLGELDAASHHVEAHVATRRDARDTTASLGHLALMAWRGSEAGMARLAEDDGTTTQACGGSRVRLHMNYCRAVLYNGLGSYAAALNALFDCHAHEGLFACYLLPELVEAAARAGERAIAATAARRLADRTRLNRTEWGLGFQTRSLALVSDGDLADDLYRASIEHFRRTRAFGHLARAHLLYGEWLRRERRRRDAREQLRRSHAMFSSLGAAAFAVRAERELLATGERARKRTVDTANDLTPREAQIALLARDGRSNRQIASTLFISARTVEYHLSKVFTKLAIRSRAELVHRLEY